MIKLIKYCYILIIFAAFISINPVKASAGTSPIPDDPAVLCLPGIYLINPGNCNPDGPSSYLTRMAQEGITLPLKGLPASKPDKALTQVDLHYGIVRTKSAPVYSSVEDALNAAKRNAVRHIEAPFSYISYTDEVMVDGKRFYQIEPGSWMTANDISRIGSFSQFQGVTFSRTPDNGFGWVLSYLSATPVESKQTPGYAKSDYTGHVFQPLELVQIYETKKVNDADWVMIAPDEWLPKRVVAGVTPNTTPPAGVTGDRWIEVNLYQQTISVYDHRQLVYATIMASGLEPLWTKPGLFQIYEKYQSAMMRGAFDNGSDAYYLEDVPWTMYFDGARALHGAYWRANLGFPQSHGCVNMTVGDAHWLFDWAKEGDWVYVWDPSGKTPTDPSVYGEGGA